MIDKKDLENRIITPRNLCLTENALIVITDGSLREVMWLKYISVLTPPGFKVEAFDWLGISYVPTCLLPLGRETGNFSPSALVIKGEDSASCQ